MIRAIANKRIDLTNEEYQVYKEIVSVVDKNEFKETFETDKNGKIIAVFPPVKKNVSMVVIYFLFNVMVNQRVRSMDFLVQEINNLKKEVKKLQEKE